MEKNNFYQQILKVSDNSSLTNSSIIGILKNIMKFYDEELFNKKIENLISYCNENNYSFDEFFYTFHKSMRQTDFSDSLMNPDKQIEFSGNLDMIFWDFIQISELPYKIFKDIFEKLLKSKKSSNLHISLFAFK